MKKYKRGRLFLISLKYRGKWVSGILMGVLCTLCRHNCANIGLTLHLLVIVDMLTAQNRPLTSNRDANVSFGTDVPYGLKKKIIQRHKSYLKIQDGRRQSKMATVGHLGKQIRLIDQEPLEL